MSGTRGRRSARGRRARPGPRRRRWRGSGVAIPPAAARSRQLGQRVRLGHPDAAPPLRRQRAVRLGLDVLEQRRGPRAERAVGEAASASRPGPGRRVRRRAARRCAGPRSIAVVQRRRRACEAWTRSGQPSRIGQPRVRRRTTGRGRVRATRPPGSWTATTPSASSSRPTVDQPGLERRPRPAAGRGSMTSRAAASWRTPSGAPSASRRMTPPGGSGVVAVDAGRRAARPGWPAARGGRAPRARTRRPGRDRARGRRRSASGPSGRSPSRGPRARRPGRPGAAWAARIRASPSSSVARVGQVDLVGARRAHSARWRCASVRPGMATSSGSSSIRSVCGSARVSRSTSRAGEGDPAVADPDRLDPAEAGVARRAWRSGR